MKTILFLHGFFASGSCVPARALHEALDDTCRVLTPDLPLHPLEALAFIRTLCENEHPDLIVGNSCGSFYGQMISVETYIPALLGNPYFMMTEFLEPRLGEHQYKSSRQDGRQDFLIDQDLISEFRELEQIQFNRCSTEHRDKIWGIFGDNDTLAHFEPMFREHYDKVFHFPGGHTPTAEEVKTWHVPLIKQMLNQQNKNI